MFQQTAKGPVERGHVKRRQKSSKKCQKAFDTFQLFFLRRAKNVKYRQKYDKKRVFDDFRAGQKLSGPFWGALNLASTEKRSPSFDAEKCNCAPCASGTNLSGLASSESQGKTKGQQLKGKIVSEFSHFFALFQNFSPRTFPFRTKGFCSTRTKENCAMTQVRLWIWTTRTYLTFADRARHPEDDCHSSW